MDQKFKNYTEILCCRLCKSTNLKECIDFKDVPLGNNLQETRELSKQVESYELKVMKCITCNHFQLSIAVLPKFLYQTNYTYLSGTGKSFVTHLKKYVDWVIKNYNLSSSNFVVDVGSNDGSCLKFFKEKGFNVCGVDPAKKPCEIANANGIYTINNFFDSNAVDKIINKFGYADIVTSQNALAHVDNLTVTFENIYKLLKDNGIFVFEIGYFKKVLENMCFDTIYHEHIDYHHAKPLVKFLTSIGFDVLNIQENKIQGGSLRLSLQKTGNGIIKQQPKSFLESEKKSILNNELYLNNWFTSITSNMKHFYNLFLKHRKESKVCYAYGAPTKSTLLFKISKLKQDDISFVVEDNRLKIGRFLPKSSIPIVSFEKIDFNKHALVIIFAWNFSDNIIDKLKKFYKVPATIIVPLPTPRVIQLC